MRVAVFVGRRLAAGVLTLLALLLVTFAVYWALPSTPAQILYPGKIHLSNDEIRIGNHLLGADKPKAEAYGDYLWQLAHLDFGKAWTGAELVHNRTALKQQRLNPLVLGELVRTLSLLLGGALLVVLIAVPLGAWTGTRIGSWSDRTVMTVTLVGICTHPMVLGNVLQLAFGYRHLGWIMDIGYCPLRPSEWDRCGGIHDWSIHLLLPWVTFALLYLALYTRMVRASVADTLHEEFVRTARAKGASELRVLGRHVLPSASLRVLTMVGLEIGTAIGLCIYIEHVFSLNGIASAAIDAMGGAESNIDLPYTLALVTLITVVVVLGNLVVDALYAILDPRAGWRPDSSRTKTVAGVI
jgi:peptide/nickel transport system permease protein